MTNERERERERERCSCNGRLASSTALYSRSKSSQDNILTLDDVFDPRFSSKHYGGSWIGKHRSLVTKFSDLFPIASIIVTQLQLILTLKNTFFYHSGAELVSMSTERGVTLYDPSSNQQRTLISADELVRTLYEVLPYFHSHVRCCAAVCRDH